MCPPLILGTLAAFSGNQATHYQHKELDLEGWGQPCCLMKTNSLDSNDFAWFTMCVANICQESTECK